MGKKSNGAGSGEKLSRKRYERELRRLHAELVAMQEWVKATGAKVCIVFEGRDTAGKGGTIKAITEKVSPRVFRVVALPAPTEREQSQMYIQRYIRHFPAAGEVVIFDRSWYNRAGVERVMGFCTDDQYEGFMDQAPKVERMLNDAGVHVTKLWFSVTQQEQRTRFAIRQIDPVRRWKLSPMDLESLDKWDAYTAAKEAMFERTDTKHAPWTVIKSNDKKRGRINAMRFFLNQFEYEGKDSQIVYAPDKKVVARGKQIVGD